MKLIAPAAVNAPILVTVNVSSLNVISASSDSNPFVPAKITLPAVKSLAVRVFADKS